MFMGLLRCRNAVFARKIVVLCAPKSCQQAHPDHVGEEMSLQEKIIGQPDETSGEQAQAGRLAP